MKDVIKRWNELAGTNKNLSEGNESKIAAQDLFGNQFFSLGWDIVGCKFEFYVKNRAPNRLEMSGA